MPTAPPTQRQFPCSQCGAALTFDPGTTSMVCSHCGGHTEIPVSNELIENLDYDAYIAALPPEEISQQALMVKCSGCGAETKLGPDVTADKCLFCGSPVVAEAQSVRQIKPRALLPFAIDRKKAQLAFTNWISSLWFAPSDLKKSNCDGLTGVYMPCWTFNTNALTEYTGERGEDYTETETYTVEVDGKTETRTREVTKTNWYNVSGSVQDSFNDLIVMASTSLPQKQAAKLEPWDFENLVAYADEYLSGFAAESYQIDLGQGFEKAKDQTVPVIRRSIERDIGGDHQRISSMDSEYMNTTFKHILLPLWISAYLYAMKSYRFLVNARTGEVQGERPYSAWKIAGLVVTIIAVIILLIVMGHHRH